MIDKPSDREEEFFARQEFERRKKNSTTCTAQNAV